jgi:hypothetical protein
VSIRVVRIVRSSEGRKGVALRRTVGFGVYAHAQASVSSHVTSFFFWVVQAYDNVI